MFPIGPIGIHIGIQSCARQPIAKHTTNVNVSQVI